MDTKNILGTAVGLQSLSLVSQSGKMLKNNLKVKPKAIKKQGKRLVKGSVDLMLGVGLLNATAGMVK